MTVEVLIEMLHSCNPNAPVFLNMHDKSSHCYSIICDANKDNKYTKTSTIETFFRFNPACKEVVVLQGDE